MFLLDLISSVNHALPRLVAAAAEASDDEPSFGPRIRCAFLERTSELTQLHVSASRRGAWERLGSATVGTLGAGSIATAAAQSLQQRYGCSTVALLAESANDSDTDRPAESHRTSPSET